MAGCQGYIVSPKAADDRFLSERQIREGMEMAEKYGKLIDPKVTAKLMDELGYSTKKRFGQNFLVDERVLDRIMDGSEITKETTVLEIGPGVGTMTQAIAERAGRVIAVEIDRDLIPVLEKTLAGYDNVTVINKDILEVDLVTLDGLLPVGSTYKVVANLPYYITTPIIMELLECGAPIDSITVMVQKEVAERMEAAPGGKEYGALSVAVQYYCIPEILTKVPCCCFIPRPNVDSAVIRLICREHPEVIAITKTEKNGTVTETGETVEVRDPDFMFRLVRAAFAQRRKTLANSIKNDPSLGFPREEVAEVLEQMGLGADIRGERLSTAQFAEFSNRLKN